MVSFFLIKASLSRAFPLGDGHLGQAGAGGAHSWAMRAKICPNIVRDTATSAIWMVTYRNHASLRQHSLEVIQPDGGIFGRTFADCQVTTLQAP
jgi:hypothetical protein